ncbi:hypothetical protein C9926_03415 [Sulfurovum lithotrophicum]|nr:hypothetical protein C9926_03415 [Sulfurovum lithotrophicum]
MNKPDQKSKNILAKLVGLKDAKRVSPTIFTIFDLPKGTPYKIIKNDFSYLQKRLVNDDTENQNKVYFLGAPLSDVGIICNIGIVFFQ